MEPYATPDTLPNPFLGLQASLPAEPEAQASASPGSRVRFIVDVDPVAQPRQRHRIVGKGRTAHVVNYIPDDDPVTAYKAAVRRAARLAWPWAPVDTPVRIDLTFVFARPARLIWKMRPMPRQWYIAKPDKDNLEKAVLDAMSGTLFTDDCRVCDGRVCKFYAAGDERPHVEIEMQVIA